MFQSFHATDHFCGSRSLSLSPRVFMKVTDAAFVPLREQGIRILNYLDDWLILAQSRDQLYEHRDLVLVHLSQLGLRVNWEKSKLSPTQRISFLGMELDSVEQTACLTQERAQSVLNCLNTFKCRTAVPLKLFQRLLGHMAAAAAVTPLGLLHMRPLQHWLHGRVPRRAWQRGTHWVKVTPACRQTFTPWSDPMFLRAGVPLEQVSRHAVVHTDASTTGWGATYDGQAVSGVWTGPQLHWHINCLELLAVHLALIRLKGRLRGKHVLVRTDNTATVAYINRQGGLRSRRMSQLARLLLLWSQKHLRSLRAIHIPGLHNRAADELSRAALPGEWRLHPQSVQLIWRHFGEAQVDLFASPETSHCQLFYSLTKGTLGMDALAHSWPRGLRKYAFPPVRLLAQTLCKIREDEEQVLLVAPYWPTRTWLGPWMGCGGSSGTCSLSGVPPTKRTPRRCPIRVVLSFLQHGLERRLSPSTLKVYVAAISAHHDPIEGKSVGKHDLVIRFLRGARRLNPPRPPLLLTALRQAPFEPLHSVELKFLSMKTLLLLALASIKRVGDLHAFSVDESCLEFGPARLCAQGSHNSLQGPGGEPAGAAPGGGRPSPSFALSRPSPKIVASSLNYKCCILLGAGSWRLADRYL
ncbi:ORF V: Enzymatic polyprotein [Labeo rohita]|uniref:ribonuclease H n=1 Tax=Labeo rohita TaxID=84645 RepID=A0ABQ8LEU8_LABRO|nr:ORF V: Enzymatic polyprotein [Labeo rohita]